MVTIVSNQRFVGLLRQSTVSLIILLLILVSVAAEDLEILVEGKPIEQSYTLKPGQQIEVTTKISAGVLIKEIKITSDNPFFQQVLGHAFEQDQFRREVTPKESKAAVTMPTILPSGKSGLSIEIRYNQELVDKWYKAQTEVNIQGGSTLLKIATRLLTEQASTELANWLTGYKIPRADPDITLDDLTKADLAVLGLGIEDYTQIMRLMAEADSLAKAGKEEEAEVIMAGVRSKLPIITELSSKEENPSIGELKVKSPKTAGLLEGSIQPIITTTSKAYSIKAGNKILTKSKVTISIFAPEQEGVSNVNTVVYIPKEIAQTSDDLEFSQEPLIVEKDPVVKWAFKNIPQDQIKDYTFTVNKDIQNFEVLAGTTAEKPSLMFRIVKWLIELFGAKGG